MVISRRRALKMLAVGGVAGLAPRTVEASSTPGARPYPLPPRRLVPDRASEAAYEGYYQRGCCYGVFNGLIGQLADRYGAPYGTIPLQIIAYGETGVAGYGSLCGALNGGAAAIGLLYEGEDRDALISTLFNWYADSLLPAYQPTAPRLDYEPSQTVAGSVLCYASATLWCEASRFAAASLERRERCARLSADTAGKAASLLNQRLDGMLFAASHASAETRLERHGADKDAPYTKGVMGCAPYHGQKTLHRLILRTVMPIKKKLGLLQATSVLPAPAGKCRRPVRRSF